MMLEFIVAGTHNADDETIYCPFILADALFHDLTSASNHDGAAFLKEYMDSTKSYPIMKLDAVSAVIKDNRKIAELEKLLERYYHKVDIYVKQAEQPLFDGNRTVAYTIYDEQLNHTVGLLNKNLRTLRRLYPVFLFLETLMLFTVFYFYFHTRKQAFALSRVLGFSRRMLMAAALIETSIVCAFGAILYIVFAGVVHVYALILGVITAIMATYSSVTLHTRMGRILKIGMREGI
ncbi:MAG: hypothetical protein Q4A41_01895 [Bacillota bacterium]|nr:hypothetical protein [Bacillota bacterium]